MITLAAIATPALIGDRPAELLVTLAIVSLVPIALMTLTSFLKIVVVLSLTRTALGAPQIPPSTAITGLALLLTFVAMSPTAEECWRKASAVQGGGVERTLQSVEAGAEPLRGFLRRFARADDRRGFLELARRARESGSTVGEDDLSVLAPAFVVSELRRAFTIGFLLFLPLLVVDLLVANVLLALGLSQLSPTTVALPFKLLLFVAVDGWSLIARGLVTGYLR